MKPRLTERQNEAIEFIRSFMRNEHKPPTLQEIGDALGISSTNGVFKLLQALEKKEYIEREPHAARSLRLVDDDTDPFGLEARAPSLPLVSRTTSSQPEQLRRRPRAYLPVAPYFVSQIPDAEEHCLLAHAGDDGMNGEGIRKGDILIVEEAPWEELHNGELVAALVHETVQARRFDYVNGRIHLRPADRTYNEETYAPDDPGCHVIGRAVGLMRRL